MMMQQVSSVFVLLLIVFNSCIASTYNFPQRVFPCGDTSCDSRVMTLNVLSEGSRLFFTAQSPTDELKRQFFTLSLSPNSQGAVQLGDLTISPLESKYLQFAQDAYLLVDMIASQVFELNTTSVTVKSIYSEQEPDDSNVLSAILCYDSLYLLFQDRLVTLDLVTSNKQMQTIHRFERNLQSPELFCMSGPSIVASSSNIGFFSFNKLANYSMKSYTLCNESNIDCVAVKSASVLHNDNSAIVFSGMSDSATSGLFRLNIETGIHPICDNSVCPNANYITVTKDDSVFFFSSPTLDNSTKSQVLQYSDGAVTYVVHDFSNLENVEYYSSDLETKSLIIGNNFIYTLTTIQQSELWMTSTLSEVSTKLYSSYFYIDNLVYDHANNRLLFTELQSLNPVPTLENVFTYSRLMEMDMTTKEVKFVHVQCNSDPCGSPLFYQPFVTDFANDTIFFNMIFEESIGLYTIDQSRYVPPVSSSSTALLSSPFTSVTTEKTASSSTHREPSRISPGLLVTIVAAALTAIAIVLMVIVLVIRCILSRKETSYDRI